MLILLQFNFLNKIKLTAKLFVSKHINTTHFIKSNKFSSALFGSENRRRKLPASRFEQKHRHIDSNIQVRCHTAAHIRQGPLSNDGKAHARVLQVGERK